MKCTKREEAWDGCFLDIIIDLIAAFSEFQSGDTCLDRQVFIRMAA
jgi:hypothetical protein